MIKIPRQSKYIIKAESGYEPFVQYKEENGCQFVERLGWGLSFRKDGQTKVAIIRMFTRNYIVIADFE